MSAPPLHLSVVVPSHNTRELTVRCIDSVARADPDAGIVLVDDAGTDGTAEEVSRRYPRAIVLRCPRPAGFTRAANLGLGRAHGDILLLLNSDTEVDAAGLVAVHAAFTADPGLGAAGAVLSYPDGSAQWSGGRAPTLPWLFALASGAAALLGRLPFYRRFKPPGAGPAAVEWVTGAALAIRREAWDQAGPLDESFVFYGQDLDLCLAVREAGWRVALLPDFRVLHHHGATIGGKPGTGGGRQHPELLWTDLLRWARKRKGKRWAGRAALALAAGGAANLLARALLAPFRRAAERPAWSARNRALREAVRSVLRSRT